MIFLEKKPIISIETCSKLQKVLHKKCGHIWVKYWQVISNEIHTKFHQLNKKCVGILFVWLIVQGINDSLKRMLNNLRTIPKQYPVTYWLNKQKYKSISCLIICKNRDLNSKLGPDLKNNLFVVNFRWLIYEDKKKHLQFQLYNNIR